MSRERVPFPTAASSGIPAQLTRPPTPAAMDDSADTSHGAEAVAAVSSEPRGGGAPPAASAVMALMLRGSASCAGGVYASETTRPNGGTTDAGSADASRRCSQSGLRGMIGCEAVEESDSCTPREGRADESPPAPSLSPTPLPPTMIATGNAEGVPEREEAPPPPPPPPLSAPPGMHVNGAERDVAPAPGPLKPRL